MGILSNSAIIVLLVCNGVIGAKSEGLGQCENVHNLTYFRDLSEVIEQAVPLIKGQLKLSVIKVLNWENVQRWEVMEGFRWEITINTDLNYEGVARKKQIIFEADQQNATKCKKDKLVCIKKVHVVKPAVDGNGVNGNGGEVVAWQYVTNLTVFRDVYEVINQALPIIKEQFNLSSIEVLNWKNAQRKKVMGGSKWAITIDANVTYGNTSHGQQFNIEADQRIAKECENNKIVCTKEVRLVELSGCATKYSEYQDVPSFDHFRVLFKAIKPMLQFRRKEAEDPYLNIVGIIEAKYQRLTNGTKWQIVTGVREATVLKKKVLSSTMDVLQLPPEYCQVEGNICFEDVDEDNFQFLAITKTLPLTKSFSRRFNCCDPNLPEIIFDDWE